jgi:hypothetical protein
LDIEHADLAGEHDEVQQDIGVHDQEQDRSEPKETLQRKIDAPKTGA